MQAARWPSRYQTNFRRCNSRRSREGGDVRSHAPTLHERHDSSRDVNTQRAVRKINEERRGRGSFEVRLCFWEDVVLLLQQHPEVYLKYYTAFILTAQQFAPALAAKHTSANLPEPSSISGLALNEILQAELDAQMDGVKALLRQDHASAALQEAKALSARVGQRSDPQTRTRLHGFIGLIEMELGNNDQAATELIKGLDETPQGSKAYGYAALACSLRADSPGATEWARRAIDKDPSNVLALQILILCDSRGDDAVRTLAEEAFGPRADTLSALSQRAVSKGDLRRGLHWAESALKAEPNSRSLQATVAELNVLLVARSESSSGNISEAERKGLKDWGDFLFGAWIRLEPALQRARFAWLRSATVA